MSREIKFRGWDKYDKKMIYDLCQVDSFWHYYSYSDNTGLHFGKTGPNGVGEDFENKYIMQYTGLKDKNNKKIYEGDVLSGGNEYDKRYGTPVIKIGNYEECKELFDEDGDFYELSCTGVYFEFNDNTCTGIDYTCISKFEVIGNIYENPELLEEKQ